MTYFNLHVFNPQTSKKIVIGINVLLIILGVVSFAYGMIFTQIESIYDNFGFMDGTFLKLLPDIRKCFFTVQSLIQIAINVFAILLILEKIGKQNKLLYLRITLILLIFQFGFIFVIAVNTSISSTIYRMIFEEIIDYDDALIKALNQGNKRYFYTIKNFFNFTIAQAIISWILSVPASVILLISFLNGLVNKSQTKQNQKTQINLRAIVHPQRTH